jgi:hypothetical protein
VEESGVTKSLRSLALGLVLCKQAFPVEFKLLRSEAEWYRVKASQAAHRGTEVR